MFSGTFLLIDKSRYFRYTSWKSRRVRLSDPRGSRQIPV